MSVDQLWRFIRPAEKITGKRSYIFIPVFSYSITWNGASEIITQFNYTAERNFVLPRDVVAPDDPNFVACIKWVDEDENVFRYKLWDNAALRLNAPLISTNKKIGKEFTIEIWSLEGKNEVSLDKQIKIYTSLIKEIVDINDIAEVEEDETIDEVPYAQLLNTNLLSNIYSTVAEFEALTPNPDILGWYKLEDGDPTTILNNGGILEWYDQSGYGRTILQASVPNTPTYFNTGFGPKNKPFLRFDDLKQMESAPFVFDNLPETIYIVMRIVGQVNTGKIFEDGGRDLIEISPSEGKVKFTILSSVPVSNEIFYDGFNKTFLLIAGRGSRSASVDFTQILETGPYLQPFESSLIPAIRTAEPAATLFRVGDVGLAGVTFDIAELIITTGAYDADDQPTDFDQAIRRYLANRFEGLMELPFTFTRRAATPITQ